MSVTCGFYNSHNGDRKYDAIQMSRIFEGIFLDGILASIGTAFVVNAGSGNTVNVGAGKAWFNNSWIYNDSVLPLTAPSSNSQYDRIDAVVIEINATDPVRANTIKFVTGDPSANPVRPTMMRSSRVNQYALCYIKRSKGSTEIKGSDITNVIGSETRLINGPLEPINASELLSQWEAQLDEFVASETAELERKAKQLDTWTENEKTEFISWFNEMRNQLSEDAAGSLQIQIDKEEIDRILVSGLVDGVTTIEANGTISTTDSLGRLLLTEFMDESTIVKTLVSERGVILGTLVKKIDDSGTKITSTVSYS